MILCRSRWSVHSRALRSASRGSACPAAGLRPRGVRWNEQPRLLAGHMVVQNLVETLENGACER